MPYIEAKLSIELNDNQKDELQAKLANAVSSAFSKLCSNFRINSITDSNNHIQIIIF